MTLAVITGPSRGIGRATSLALATRGVELALVGRPSPDLDGVAAAVAGVGSRAEIVRCDVEDPDAIASAAARILTSVGLPDIVIHNAAMIERARVEDVSVELWDRHMAVNVRAPFLLTREFLKGMVARGRGRHVFVGSISSTLGTAGAAPYCASKWALVGFVKSLAQELSDTGVTAMAVLPGSVDTRMLEGSGFSPRMTPEDVATTIAFCALDAPDAHNGAVVEMFAT